MLIAFNPGYSLGARGIEQAEIERRFTPIEVLLGMGDHAAIDFDGKNPTLYLLQRQAT